MKTTSEETAKGFGPRPPGLLAWLSRLPPGRLLLLVYLLLLAGGALPYVVAPEGLGCFRPHPRGFQSGEALRAFLNNGFIALAVYRLIPRLEKWLPPSWQGGWSSKLFLMCSALVTGVKASPHGLPQGAWYLAWVSPLALGEYLALTLAVYGRLGAALLLLALLAVYEGWVTGWV